MAGLESESFQELVDAEKGLQWEKRLPGLVTHLLPFGSQQPISSALTAWQGTYLHPKGSCYLSPAQGRRQDLDNPGKNEQMALLSQELGWQPPPPLLPEAQAGCLLGSS